MDIQHCINCGQNERPSLKEWNEFEEWDFKYHGIGGPTHYVCPNCRSEVAARIDAINPHRELKNTLGCIAIIPPFIVSALIYAHLLDSDWTETSAGIVGIVVLLVSGLSEWTLYKLGVYVYLTRKVRQSKKWDSIVNGR